MSNNTSERPSTRTFDVRKAVGLAPDVPDLKVEMSLQTVDNREVDFIKTGDGVMALEQMSGRFRGTATVLEGTLLLNGPYATQSVMNVFYTPQGNPQSANVLYLDSTDGLYVTQPTDIPWPNNLGNTNFIAQVNHTAKTVSMGSSNYFNIWNTEGIYAVTFLACGTLGRADVTVSGGTLGGTGGTGGSVTVEYGGVFDPGTLSEPVGVFNVGGNLDFGGGGTWKIDIADEDVCDVVHVAGDILLENGVALPEFPKGEKPIIGNWLIATCGGVAGGTMTAPAGYKVYVDSSTQSVYLRNCGPGSLFILR